MRLVCPNCDAEYEIDDAAIPSDGRDVQCSNCGHAWFQHHPDAEADDVPEPLPWAAATPAVTPAATPAVEEAPVAVGPLPKARTLDETVLAVLREEADRETAARRADAASKPVIETQTELPLAQDSVGMAAAVRRIARMRGVPAAADPEPEAVAEPSREPVPEPVPEPAVPARSRSAMLPAIEEINSTLRSTNSRTSDEDSAIVDTMAEAEDRRGGFRRGFLTLITLAVLVVVLYVAAPLIKTTVPELAGVVDGYVAGVNAARVGLDTGLRSLVQMLNGLASGQGA